MQHVTHSSRNSAFNLGANAERNRTMSTYTIDVHADGSATVHVWTDDNFDLGYPTETATWDLHYASFADALRYTGGTRTSLYGQPIDVFVNGILIDRTGKPTTPEEREPRPQW